MAFEFEAVDPKVSFETQLQQDDSGTVVLINTLVVPEGQMDKTLESWAVDAAYMKSCDGCISTQLHRGTGGSNTLVNIAVWESTSSLLKAFMSAEFQEKAGAYPDGLLARPFLAEKVAVPGICVA
jgi:heme-degrading monooxygenase HmoA